MGNVITAKQIADSAKIAWRLLGYEGQAPELWFKERYNVKEHDVLFDQEIGVRMNSSDLIAIILDSILEYGLMGVPIEIDDALACGKWEWKTKK